MASFMFVETGPQIGDSTCFGATSDVADNFLPEDIGKIVKLGTLGHNHVLAVEDDEIEGFVLTIEPNTRNDGFTFGTVERVNQFYRKVVEVGANAVDTDVVTLGGLVVADEQAALGTAGNPMVKGGAPTKFKWRVIRAIDGLDPGDLVLIERI